MARSAEFSRPISSDLSVDSSPEARASGPGSRPRGNLTAEVRAVIAAIGAAIVATIVSAAIFWDVTVGLGGDTSVGGVASQLSAVIGFAAFAWAYARSARSRATWRERSRFRRLLDTAGLALTGGVMSALLIGSVFSLLQLAFRDLELDTATAVALVTGTVAFSTYVLFLLATNITTGRLVSMLALFLVAGLFASMLTADDPRWWVSNFSALGMDGETSAQTFNLTIVLAGLVIVTLADYLTTDLRSRQTSRGADLKGVTVVRTTLIVIGIALIGVGVVPVNVSLLVHNIFAISAIGGFGALLVIVPIFIQGLPGSFTALTTAFVVSIVIAVLLFWPIGYYNLTAVELVAVLVVFAWLVLFVRYTSDDSQSLDASNGRGAQPPAMTAAALAEIAVATNALHVPGEGRDLAGSDRSGISPALVGASAAAAAAVGYAFGRRSRPRGARPARRFPGR